MKIIGFVQSRETKKFDERATISQKKLGEEMKTRKLTKKRRRSYK